MTVRYFNQLPKPYTAYPRIARQLFAQVAMQVKDQFTSPLHSDKSAETSFHWPHADYCVQSLNIDPAHLKRYQSITGFEQNEYIPALYLVVLAQSLQMQMMTHERFPFPILGLVHIGNQVKQYRPIKSSETIQLNCAFGELKPHDKGQQFDFIVTAKVDQTVVMEGLTTYLYRSTEPARSTETTSSQRTDTTDDLAVTTNKTGLHPSSIDLSLFDQKPIEQQWHVAEDLGRRYAMVSGDFNFIHLHALPAKAFGFDKAIAHGMWSHARALSALQPLPDAYDSAVQFKLPVALPSTIGLVSNQTSDCTEFILYNIDQRKPHVVGYLIAQSED